MVQKRGITKAEIAITVVCLLLIWLSWFGLENIDEYLANLDLDVKRPVIGKIVVTKNDTRHRRTGSFVWFKARNQQEVRKGDSVFSGEKSKIQVGLKNGSEIVVGENSLIVFNDFDELGMPDVQFGNFTYRINGKTSLMIDGQLTTFNGQNSEVQIALNKGQKPIVRLLKGSASIETSEQAATALALNQTQKVKLRDDSFIPPKSVILTDYRKEDDYYWHLYEIYETTGLSLKEKEVLPKAVNKVHGVAWSDALELNSIVEFGTDPTFREKERLVSITGGFVFRKLNVGPNFWRVSIDLGRTWSKAEQFNINAKFNEAARPRITKFGEQIPMITKKSTIQLDVKVPLDTIGYAVDASHTADFNQADTRRFWSPGRQIKLSFYKTGQYFYRFRSVSKTQELSTWSDTQKFNVYIPSIPDAPDLMKLSRRDGSPGEVFRINWDVKGAVTKTAILDSNGLMVSEELGTTVKFQPKRTGRYKVVARAYNEFGQAGPTSKPFFLRVAPQPNHLLQAMKDAQKRKLAQAAEGQSALKLDDLALPEKRNTAYKSSQLSVRGMLWTLQSSDQFYSDKANSVAAGVAIRGIKWIENLGVEGLFKSHVAGLTKDGGTDLQSVDVRLHKRFFVSLPVKFAPETQISGFVGYGTSRNTGDNFTENYDLVKFGTSLEFPIGNNWMTGGEFVYGMSGDKSTQGEIAGHIDYFTSRDWSFGVGYRLYLFEAGTASAAPNGTLPYREGYTEGFSSLNYHF